MDSIQAVKEFIETAMRHMQIECQVEVSGEEKQVGQALSVMLLSPRDGRFLIGKGGQNLQAFECLVRAFCARNVPHATNVFVDINDYRRLKAQQAIETARQVVARVRASQKAEALAPMTSYERRIVHMELAACTDIATESIGEGANRRVIIKPFSLDA
jgi:spoIIIJ-associated protein